MKLKIIFMLGIVGTLLFLTPLTVSTFLWLVSTRCEFPLGFTFTWAMLSFASLVAIGYAWGKGGI